jgi:hypothetical protein
MPECFHRASRQIKLLDYRHKRAGMTLARQTAWLNSDA